MNPSVDSSPSTARSSSEVHRRFRHGRQDRSERQGQPEGKLADAELHFNDGVLDGLKLIGFAVWERQSGSGRNVTFPSREYTVSGDRRSFALRPISDAAPQERVRDLVLQAYAEYEETTGESAS